MSQPIVYIDRSRIHPGRVDDVKQKVGDLVAFIDAREPQLLTYGFSIDEEASRMTVVAVHPDSASLELHMEVGGEAFRGFADLLDLEAIDVYGDPSDRVVEQLRQKAEMLSEDAHVGVHRLDAGFARQLAVSAP